MGKFVEFDQLTINQIMFEVYRMLCLNVCLRLIRGMAGKFVDTPAIRKSNASLKRRFA